MTTEQFNESVNAEIRRMTNKAKEPTSFSEWLEQNNDSIDIGGNDIQDRIAANHDQYDQEERVFDGEDAEEWQRRSEREGLNPNEF